MWKKNHEKLIDSNHFFTVSHVCETFRKRSTEKLISYTRTNFSTPDVSGTVNDNPSWRLFGDTPQDSFRLISEGIITHQLWWYWHELCLALHSAAYYTCRPLSARLLRQVYAIHRADLVRTMGENLHLYSLIYRADLVSFTGTIFFMYTLCISRRFPLFHRPSSPVIHSASHADSSVSQA